MSEAIAWSIFLLPIASFALIVLVIRPFFNLHSRLAGYLTILAVGASMLLSLLALEAVIRTDEGVIWPSHMWLTVGEMEFAVGIIMDPLTVIMLVIVTSVSLMVQLYSVGYMKGDSGYARYYAYMSLFTASMVGLVMASNVIQLFVFWELVGLCSYLLIGFWYHRPEAAAAAKKAFVITRLGDLGFLLAIMYLYFNYSTFAEHGLNALSIPDIYKAIAMGGVLTSGTITWIAVGVFAGAVGKSAQFPLHTWLPDAMEGPTPVSALIHAAAMVAAGVFLVARFFPLFEAAEIAMNLVAIIGGVTAVFAASIALVMNDIKRVLAYSTISQLGYMMLALGVGAYGAAIFHLFTHAFFKSLLFLGSGNVFHASGTFDMRYMGGLRKIMPWTYVTFLIGALSLSGIFPMSGFWSKDEILAHAWSHNGLVSQLVFWLAMSAVFMTSFYIFRVLFMTFEGQFKGGAENDNGAPSDVAGVHLAECPAIMVWPLVLLGGASVAIGFLVNPVVDLGIVPLHWFTEFLAKGPVHMEVGSFNSTLAVISSILALSGILLAVVVHRYGVLHVWGLGHLLRPVHKLLSRQYYLDDIYEKYLVTRFFYRRFTATLDWIDKDIIDRMVNTIGWIGANIGGALRQAQTGQLQGYGMAISVGILMIMGVYILFL